MERMGRPAPSLPATLSPSPSAATAAAAANVRSALVRPSPIIEPPSSSSASSTSKKQPGSRRTLSCLPCRQHKLKCDRHVPCRSCARYRREDQCLQNPAPSSVLSGRSPAQPQAAVAVPFRGSSRDVSAGDPSPQPPVVWSSATASSATNSTTPPTRVSAGQDSPDSGPPPVEESLSSTNGKSFSSQRTSQQQDSDQNNPPWPTSLFSTWSSDTSLLPPLSAPFLEPVDQKSFSRQTDVAMFWKRQLLSVLPRRTQCDLLVSYYTDHMDWVYHSVHLPSFRKSYNEFWESDVADIDIAWLSLLYTIISCGALYVPLNEAELVGMDKSNLRNMAHVWHSASRQALNASGFESKPGLTQLQTFEVTQLYWLATRTIETMNSSLGQAIRNAQALGLDKDTAGANPLDTEIRRRIWWELFNCDTFQSICLSRAPLIHSSGLKVPFPLNSNDVDVTETSVRSRPMDEPTDISATILRARIFLVFRKLFTDDPELLSSYDYIQSIDVELQEEVANFPWYFQLESCQELLPSRDFIVWQYHIIHSCICMQRIRMHRPFLQQQIGESWNVCAKAARDVLSVYKVLRTPDIERLCRSHKFYVQAYQIFSAAVAQAAFLLVERSFPVETIRNDIEMVISDLSLGGLGDVGVSTMADGKKILMTMLDMSDRRRRREPLEPESLVPEISDVFGGEQTTRKYLTRCDIGYVLNRDSTATPDRLDRGSARPSDVNSVATDSQGQVIYPTQMQEVHDLSEFFNSYYSTQPDPGLPFGIMDTDQWGSFLSGAAFNF